MISPLKQSCDPAVFCHVDPVGCRNLRKSGHRHYSSGEHDYKARARADIDFTDMDIKAFRSAQLFRVIGEGVLVLRHTYREGRKSHSLDLRKLFLYSRLVDDAAGAVNLF